ncbi:UDP-N-acetylmuramate--L-alanine ligase [Tissierella sp. MSJ-40]|uniref:UDP-N-acetylmuramate--L-alanine ligase n=1 Tax=Tissierella simiarum TaxID=2841534 RepID=A0ABS6E9R5_9FIRM|nr:UDP-N-acetylmuramate--L-alanine ligase [Tissierella simiarum]MBU5439281.1 UDP-N-acetylmuramate--L-alanine ligase [Tissierella simiarum]
MFTFCINDHKYSHVHFIGIGGISMSGLAEILLTEGYKVSGSDANNSHIIERLEKLGAEIYINHSMENVKGADLIVYTDAISKDNEELLQAYELGVPVVDRALFLGALMNNYHNSIAVSGTHGKTTTTSMIATILNRSELDSTILLGGQLDEIGGNVKLGSKKYLLTEACEYKGNILKYYPTMAIILNIEEDHLDYFKNIDHIVDTFVQYGSNIKENGYLIINEDDINAKKVIENTKANVVTFGINNKSDYTAENISFSEEGYPSFMLNIRGKSLFPITLGVMGIHNVYNALASIAAANTSGISMELIQESIGDYKGTHRRLELKGYANGIKIIDDYAHHPTEIKAALKALRNSTQGNIWCVFQPHTFTRIRLLLNNFAESFGDANKVIVTDIYAAREKDTGLVHSKDLANALTQKGIDAKYISSFEEIETYLMNNTKDNDIIVTMGAGNVYSIGDSIIEHNKEKEKEAI